MKNVSAAYILFFALLFVFQNCSIGSKFQSSSIPSKSELKNLAQPSAPFDTIQIQKKSLISPEDFSSVQYIANFDSYDKGKVYVIGRHMGSAAELYQRPITDLMLRDLTTKTSLPYNPMAGVFPHNENIQTFLPSTLQHKDSEFGLVISTKDLKHVGRFKPIAGGGPHWIIGRDFSPIERVFANNQSGIDFSLTAAVPHAYYRSSLGQLIEKGDAGLGYSVGQLSFVFYFKHVQLNEYIVVLVNLYEPQGAGPAIVMNDGQVSFVSAKLGLPGSEKYVKPHPGSGTYSELPFKQKRNFSARISRTEMLTAIQSINEFRKTKNHSPLSENPSDYGLELGLVLFEVPNFAEGYAETEVSAYLKDFQISAIQNNIK